MKFILRLVSIAAFVLALNAQSNLPRHAPQLEITRSSVTEKLELDLADDYGSWNISAAHVVLAPTQEGHFSQSCIIYVYTDDHPAIYVYDTQLQRWSEPAQLGSKGTLSGGNCVVDLEGSSIAAAQFPLSRLTLTLAITYPVGFMSYGWLTVTNQQFGYTYGMFRCGGFSCPAMERN